MQGAEIDKKIADIATDYFGLPGSVTVAVEDGRAYLAASKEKFDVIMVDAYQDITIPFQLSSVEFFNEVQAHLKPNGVMVVNLNMTSAEDGSINEYLCDTMASVFRGWLAALAFSLMICIGAVMLFQKGTFLIGAQRAAILSTFEPITSIFVGILFLNETLTPRILLGSAITLVAGVFITLGGKKDEDKEEAAKD